jgi:pimeloyl-ACP methyl ester carboxylesterase
MKISEEEQTRKEITMDTKKNLLVASCHGLLFVACVLFMALTMIQCSDSFVEPAAQPEPNPPVALRAAAPPGCNDGELPGGALYRICMPPLESWNHDVVIYAHGYVAFNEPIQMPDDEMEGISVSQTVTSLGYAYATTSYRANGLVVPDAVKDLLELVTTFKTLVGEPRHILLVGASEGALIATLAIERYPQVFQGAMPASGPVGDFRKQIDYFGDLRVVFDYFFPDVFSGLDFVVPQSEAANWGLYEQKIHDAVTDPSRQHAVEQVLRVTKASVDPADPSSVEKTFHDVLRYNFLATADAMLPEKLNGQPFDNTRRWYYGSDNDFLLNRKVKRIQASPAALANMSQKYTTSGVLRRPVVTMHTLLDPVVPYWHEPIYRLKTLIGGAGFLHTNIPIPRYGHGAFKVYEVLAGFAVLVLKVTAQDLIVAESVLPDAAEQAEFLRLAQQNGAHPKMKAAARVSAR